MITYTNFFKLVASIVTTSFFGLTFLSQFLSAQDNSTNSTNSSPTWTLQVEE